MPTLSLSEQHQSSRTIALSTSASRRVLGFVRWRAHYRRLLATRRCTRCERDKSDGLPRGMSSVKSNSSSGSSALPSDHRSVRSNPLALHAVCDRFRDSVPQPISVLALLRGIPRPGVPPDIVRQSWTEIPTGNWRRSPTPRVCKSRAPPTRSAGAGCKTS